MASSNVVLSQIERLLLSDPSNIQSPKIQVLRKAFPDTPDTQLRGLLKRQDVQELFDSTQPKQKHVVLAIGDLHSPFALKPYLEFCLNVWKKEGCTLALQIGDMLTWHTASRHTKELDAYSPKEEYRRALKHNQPWDEAFPNAYALFGNHDVRVLERMKDVGLPLEILISDAAMMGVPSWQIHTEIQVDGVLYRHNAGGSPNKAAQNAVDCGQSIVGGHFHTQAGVVYRGKGNLFGCLTGCGVDRSVYDQRYNTSVVPYKWGCAVIYEGKSARWFQMDYEYDRRVFVVS